MDAAARTAFEARIAYLPATTDAARAAAHATADAARTAAAASTAAAADEAADAAADYYAARTAGAASIRAGAAAARTAYDAATSAASVPTAAAAVWASLSTESGEIAAGTLPAALALRPLWPTPAPEGIAELDRLWERLKHDLLARDEDWQVWTTWWEARRDGLPADEEKELARLTLPEETWEEGAKTIEGVKAVNAEIARRLAEIDARREAEKKPIAPDQIEGARLELSTPRGLALSVSPDPGEIDDPDVRASLHRQLRRAVPRLRDAIVTANHVYAELETVVDEYLAVVDVPFDRLDVVEVWGMGAALLGMATAFEGQDVGKTITDPLEPEQSGLLKQVVQLHGAFILGFPLAQRLMDAAERFRLASDTIAAIEGPTAEILRSFGEQEDWVEESARKFIAALGTAYHETGWKVTASGYSAYVLVRNALVVVTRHLVKANSALATVAGGYFLTQVDPGLVITEHAVRFVLDNARPIIAFSQPFPELRAWFAWVIDHLDEQNHKGK